MKIILAHNLYQQPGGEDVVVRQEAAMLRDAGHQVVLYERSNLETERFSGVKQLALFAHTTWSPDTRREFEALLVRERPDVVHVHNTFVMISPSIYGACKTTGVPVVQTLHNYRLFCPAHTFLRNGVPCEDCVTGSLLSSVRHRCYRDSAAASAAAATMLAVNRLRGTYRNDIDRYIALTEFARDKFVSCGLPAAKVVVKPNFIHPDPGERASIGNWAVFMGRLAPEKGMATALRAWKLLSPEMELKVIGDGPELENLRQYASQLELSNVTFLGRLSRQQAFEYLAGARFLLFPSEWYESFPMTILEAYAHGVPVVASRMGVVPEIVKDQQTGLLFEPRDAESLAGVVKGLWHDLGAIGRLGQNARREYKTRYTAEENLRQLMTIYGSVLEHKEKQQEVDCSCAV
jgi:glycosyltransferase involved in cell wall biosynthesis